MGLITLPTQDLSNAPAQPFIALTGTSDVTGLPEGWPQSRNDFVRFWCGNLAYTLDFIANYANKKLAYRLAEAKWAEIATATPPQEYDLPLESAFQNFLQERSVYRKDQFGVVSVEISVQTLTEIAVDAVIAYLPEGFRPATNKRAAAIAVTTQNESIAFPLFVGKSGMISLAFFSTQPAQYKTIIGQIAFVAAN